MDRPPRATHPMLIVAATAVTVASLAATAHFTGLLPGRDASPASPPAITAPAPTAAAPVADATATPAAEKMATSPAEAPPSAEPAAETPKAKAKAVARAPTPKTEKLHHTSLHHAAPPTGITAGDQGEKPVTSAAVPPLPPVAPPVCHECGTVEAVREVSEPAQGSGLGAVAGGVLGGVLGHQVGRGSGNAVATVLGAVGGAFAGNEVEKRTKATHQLEVAVRFDDGVERTYKIDDSVRWQTGDRVRVSDGKLAPL